MWLLFSSGMIFLSVTDYNQQFICIFVVKKKQIIVKMLIVRIVNDSFIYIYDIRSFDDIIHVIKYSVSLIDRVRWSITIWVRSA